LKLLGSIMLIKQVSIFDYFPGLDSL